MNIDKLREDALGRCANSGIAVFPYGNAWFLLGDGINLVVGELAGFYPEEQKRFLVTAR